MKFSIKNFLSKCDQICSFLRIWSHLQKKSLMGNFIFCAVAYVKTIWIMVLDFDTEYEMVCEKHYHKAGKQQ